MDPHHLPSASSLFPVFPFQFSLPFRSLELFQDESSGDDSKIAVTAMSPNISVSEWKQKHLIPIGSMGLVYLPTYGSLFMVNVGKYTNPMDPSWDQKSLTNHPFFFGRRRWGNLAFCFFCRVYHWPCRKSPHQHVSNAAQGPFFSKDDLSKVHFQIKFLQINRSCGISCRYIMTFAQQKTRLNAMNAYKEMGIFRSWKLSPKLIIV